MCTASTCTCHTVVCEDDSDSSDEDEAGEDIGHKPFSLDGPPSHPVPLGWPKVRGIPQ